MAVRGAFLSHLTWYCGKSVPSDTLNVLPAAVFVGNRVRMAVRCIIFFPPSTEDGADRSRRSVLLRRPLPGRTASHPPHRLAPATPPRRHPRTCPRKKNSRRANQSVLPRIPLSSRPLCPRQPPGDCPCGSVPAKKYEKKVQKNLEVREKAVPLQSRSERGAPERPRGERKRGGRESPDGIGSSLTRLEEAVQAKYRKQIRER